MLKASTVPIDRYSYEQIELLNDMVQRWSFVLSPDDVDNLRQAAGEMMRGNATYQRLLRDLKAISR